MKTRIVLVCVFAAAAASADAPPDQYDPFNPQKQDIEDHYARLDWQRIIASQTADHGSAIQACNSVGQRLPTYRELLTLVDENPHDEWDPEAGATSPRYIDPNAFPATPAGPFWSMSPGVQKNMVKVVDFETGESADFDINGSAWVRCVIDVVP
jgi:hypothetical protein